LHGLGAGYAAFYTVTLADAAESIQSARVPWWMLASQFD